MEILIHNELTGDSEVRILGSRTLTMGRDKDNDVILDSQFVSRVHGKLIYKDRQYFIQSCGLNPTYVDNEEIRADTESRLKVGNEIKIGEFTLTLIERKQRGQKQEATLNLAKKLIELETEIHCNLLARLNLGKTKSIGHEKDEDVKIVEAKLDEILNAQVSEISRNLEDFIIQQFFRKELIDRAILTKRSRGVARLTKLADHEEKHFQESTEKIVQNIIEELDLALKSSEIKNDAEKIEENFSRIFKNHWLDISSGQRKYLAKRFLKNDILNIVFGLGPLQDLIDLPNINEIMVVSKDQIYLEKDGVIQNSERAFVSDEVTIAIIERILAPIGRTISRSVPYVDARLPDGSRVNAIIPPLALKGPCITIRKFSKEPFTIDDLIAKGSLDKATANFLKACVIGRKNIIISGGTGTGKTTLLNVLSGFIPAAERIITIEDNAELQLAQQHVVSLEAKPPNIEGKGAVTIRDLVRNALRQRPDRLIVGECRGGETLDMLQAMNTGHDGSLTTAHANAPKDLLLRLETLVLMGIDMPIRAIREQIAAALQVIVQIKRFSDGSRKVTQISEVLGVDELTGDIILEDIFTFKPNVIDASNNGMKGKLRYTGYIPTFLEELISQRIITLEEIY